MATLNYYKDMIGEQDHQVSAVLNADQTAALLKAHDIGVAQLSDEERQLIDQAISHLKESIWP